jgi:VIT1/CCC1 family predicted Fe2+/Mn2+ transporter
MEHSVLSKETYDIILKMQQGELTEYYIYNNIAKTVKDPKNREILQKIAAEERMHSEIWKGYTTKTVHPKRGKIFFYRLIARLFGYTFAIKLMERGEDEASDQYDKIASEVSEAKKIAAEEQTHEYELICMLDEERLQYVGSMVLGLNDALVELSGTLAGLTFALQNTRLIALSGLITGIAATLSMASSEYLSSKSEGRSDALKSSAYTGAAYLVTVVLLILPYLLFSNTAYLWALICMLSAVILVIFVFTYYISVTKDVPFWHRFREMAFISLGVAALSFLIGLLVKQFLGVDI